MDLRVLGGLSVHEEGVPICPPTAVGRQLLALFAAHADQVVPSCVVTEELWPQGAPPDATRVLETNLRQLREAIAGALSRRGEGPRIENVLAPVPGGYRLETRGGFSDARAFARTVGASYRTMESGDLAGAAARLREALALWTAAPFADVAQGPHLRAQSALLVTSWERALDHWIDVETRRGRARELCMDLSVLLLRFRSTAPLYERLHSDLLTGHWGADVIRRHIMRRRRATLTVQRGIGQLRGARPPRWDTTAVAAGAGEGAMTPLGGA
ncbi:BTAD domain-containing putative transcriptional regulator [Streptomyces sp. NPDC088674]|uniref:AfsR/SARP family transcriptional regulator n=1 Tax=Streptomyces sp. NPDC088674 TaxID=3365869 RepID=UPI003821C6A8